MKLNIDKNCKRVIRLFIALLLTISTAACGSNTTPEPPPPPPPPPEEPTHVAPAWIKANDWKMFGFFEGRPSPDPDETLFSVNDESLVYSYPGCNVTATLVMDPNLPSVAANPYIITVNESDCPTTWDFATETGVVDMGHIFAEDSRNVYIYRISNSYNLAWGYVRK